MNFLSALIGISLFIVAPCVIAAWLGTRIRRPLIAFFLAWVLTPVISLAFTVVFWPVLRELTPPNNDGTGAIMLPFLGIVTGLVAGIVAAIIVGRCCDKAGETSAASDQNSAVVTNAEPFSLPPSQKKTKE